jgi:hypothetical protein
MTKADIGRPFRRIGSPAGSACHFFIIIVIRHETTAAAGWALLLIVSTLFNDAITVAVWTGFHVCLPMDSFDERPLSPYATALSPPSKGRSSSRAMRWTVPVPTLQASGTARRQDHAARRIERQGDCQNFVARGYSFNAAKRGATGRSVLCRPGCPTLKSSQEPDRCIGLLRARPFAGPFCAISASADCTNNAMQDRHRFKPESGSDTAYFALLSGTQLFLLLSYLNPGAFLRSSLLVSIVR